VGKWTGSTQFGAAMEALFFNVSRPETRLESFSDHPFSFLVQVSTGFLEGIVRGYKAGLLTQGHFSNLTQCETLEGMSIYPWKLTFRPRLSFADFRTQLSTTDYGNFLANEPSPVSTSTIAEKATQVLVDQFNFLRTNAVEPLNKFFDYITYVLVNPLVASPC